MVQRAAPDMRADLEADRAQCSGTLDLGDRGVGIEQGWGLEMGSRTPPADAHLLPGPLKRKPQDYFRMFHADTALSGSTAATRLGLDYFGRDHVLFASDFPFDAEGGKYLVRETIRALDELELPVAVRQQIDQGNIEKLMGNAKRGRSER